MMSLTRLRFHSSLVTFSFLLIFQISKFICLCVWVCVRMCVSVCICVCISHMTCTSTYQHTIYTEIFLLNLIKYCTLSLSPTRFLHPCKFETVFLLLPLRIFIVTPKNPSLDFIFIPLFKGRCYE